LICYNNDTAKAISTLVKSNKDGLVREERLDTFEELDLVFNGLIAHLADVHDEENSGLEVSQSSHRLHFDS